MRRAILTPDKQPAIRQEVVEFGARLWSTNVSHGWDLGREAQESNGCAQVQNPTGRQNRRWTDESDGQEASGRGDPTRLPDPKPRLSHAVQSATQRR